MFRWFIRHTENSDIRRLRKRRDHLKQELAQRDEVAIPLLQRKIELLERTVDIYQLRLETEVKRVESETGRLAKVISESIIP